MGIVFIRPTPPPFDVVAAALEHGAVARVVDGVR
jgi:hypothetical protein